MRGAPRSDDAGVAEGVSSPGPGDAWGGFHGHASGITDWRAAPRCPRIDDQAPAVFSSLLRSQTADADRVLLSHAHVWLRRIPSSLHPKRLCRCHPGMANRLASVWHDELARNHLLAQARAAARGGHLEDADRVHDEVRRLEQWVQRRIEVIYPPLDARGRRRVVSIAPA